MDLDAARLQTLKCLRRRRELGVSGSAELVLLGRLEATQRQPQKIAAVVTAQRAPMPPPQAAATVSTVPAAAASSAAGSLRLLIAMPPGRVHEASEGMRG